MQWFVAIVAALSFAGCASERNDHTESATNTSADDAGTWTDASTSGTAPPSPAANTTVKDAAASPDPVLFVHGINGSAADFAVLIDALAAAGWPRDRLFAYTFTDPKFGCNGDNAKTIAGWVATIRAQTGADKIDLVAHSMGGLSSRHFLKHGGGAALVRTYVTLGSMHHGLGTPCLSPLDVCVWKELCENGPFVADLNASPATPGPAKWVSIFSTEDGTVPVASSRLDGAENIELHGIVHSGAGGLMESAVVLDEVKRVLAYP